MKGLTQSVASVILDAVIQQGLSVGKAAALCHMQRNSFRRLLSEDRVITLPTAAKLRNAFGHEAVRIINSNAQV